MLILVRIEARKSPSQPTVTSEGVLKGKLRGASAGSSLGLQERRLGFVGDARTGSVL